MGNFKFDWRARRVVFITTLLLKCVCQERNEPKNGTLGRELHLITEMLSQFVKKFICV